MIISFFNDLGEIINDIYMGGSASFQAHSCLKWDAVQSDQDETINVFRSKINTSKRR